MKSSILKSFNEKNVKTAKYTKFIRNFKGFLLKKKKINKKKNENDTNESAFFKIMKDMMIKNLKKTDIIKYFKKERIFRSEIETRTIADYLSLNKKNIFFNMIRKINKGKLYTLVYNLTLDCYKKNDLIFLYKESMNKFCIILEGTISLYLPYFIKKNITIQEFLNYFFYTKKNFPKSFIRVEKKNENIFDGIYQLKINDYNINCLSDIDDMKKQDFYIEEHQNVYNITEGNQVNQISILYNLVQNFNGYAQTDVYLLSLNKSDFLHILRKTIEDELSKEFGKLRKYCYIFNQWTNYSLAQIMNYYIPLKLVKEEFVFNQKDESDSFYLIQDGIFDVYCEISMDEFSQYKKYVLKNNKNVIEWIKEEKEKKSKISVEKIIDYIHWKIKKEEYPKNLDIIDKNNIYIKKKILDKLEENDDHLINLKVNEDILQKRHEVIKIKLFTLQNNEFFGLEDSLELKSRFVSVQCASDKGTINKLRIIDFIVFIASNHGLNLENIIKYVNERKNAIVERLLNKLNRELINNKRNILNAYSIALSSYENRKLLNLKMKTDNIYNINYLSNLNTNKTLINKIKELDQNNKANNINIEYKEKSNKTKRKKSAKFNRTLFLKQLNQIIDNKNSKKNKNWNLNEENEYFSEKSKKKTVGNISSYRLTTPNTSNTNRKISSYRNKKPFNINNYNNKNIFLYDENDFTKEKTYFKYKNIFPDINLTITNLYSKKYDLMKNKDLSYINRKLNKEITNMTGIYNTKREISKNNLKVSSSPNKNKKHKRISSNYKLSHSININQNIINIPKSRFLTIRIKSGRLNLENDKNSIIPNMNNIQIRNCINK